MKLTPNYTDYFISPVTGKAYHVRQLPPLSEGMIWVGNNLNQAVESGSYVKNVETSVVVGNIAIFSDSFGKTISDAGTSIPDLTSLVVRAETAATNSASSAHDALGYAGEASASAIIAATYSSAAETYASAAGSSAAESLASAGVSSLAAAASSDSAGYASDYADAAGGSFRAAQTQANNSAASAAASASSASSSASSATASAASATSAATSQSQAAAILSQLYATNLEFTGDIIGSGSLFYPILTTLNLTLNQIPLATSDVNVNSHKITNLTAGSASSDAVNFSQLTSVISGGLLAANNLSDVLSISTSRTNLGLTAIATQTVTQHSTLVGGSSNSITSIAAASVGTVLRSTGTSSDPAYSSAKYPDTTVVNQILYSGLTNSISGILTVNSASLVSDSTGAPQFSSSMTNGQIIIGGTGAIPTAATLTAGSGVTIVNSSGGITISATGTGGTVTSVSGSLNRITSSGGATPVIDISSAYVGQSSITTLGAVTTGVWHGTSISEVNGGTNQTSYTLGDTLYSSAANTLLKLAGNTTSVKQYLSQAGTGTVSAAPAWSAISGSDITGSALTKTDDTNVTLTLGGTPTTALLRAASLTLGWTGILSVPRGGTGVSSVTTTPAASSFSGWDLNSNLSANNFINGYITTATAAGTTTLTVSSVRQQYFTGSTTQTVLMPVTSTLVIGQGWRIVNNSSGSVTVQSSGANNIVVISTGTQAELTCILASGTTAASWSYVLSYNSGGSVTAVTGSGNIASSGGATPNITFTGILPLVNGGTNANLTASNGGIFYSTASSAAILPGVSATGKILVSSSGGSPIWSSRILEGSISTNLFIGNTAGATAALTNPVSCLAIGAGSFNSYTNSAVNGKNTCLGINSGTALITGDYNTFTGESSGLYLTGGNNNTFYGRFSGNNSAATTCTQITLLGSDTSVSANSLINASAVGYGATESESNSMTLGNSSLLKLKTAGVLIVTNITDSTSSSTGCALFSGGVVLQKSLKIGSSASIGIARATPSGILEIVGAGGLNISDGAPNPINIKQFVIDYDVANDRTNITSIHQGVAFTDIQFTCKNIGFNGISFGGGSGCFFLANATVPTSNPTGGGLIYVSGGALKYRGSSGTVTNIANA